MKIPEPTVETKQIIFGSGQSKGQCNFVAQYYAGWFRVICFGGTGFAIECEESRTDSLLKPMLSMTEYEVITHCNKTSGWMVYDYYTHQVHRGKMRICHFDLTALKVLFNESIL